MRLIQFIEYHMLLIAFIVPIALIDHQEYSKVLDSKRNDNMVFTVFVKQKKRTDLDAGVPSLS